MAPAPVTPDQEQSLVSRVLAQGYDRLRFPEPLEREFRHDHLLASRRWVRMSLLVALATTTGFAIIDHWVIRAQNAVPDVVRFGLQFPVILFSLLATSPKLYARWYRPGIQITAPMFGLGTVLMAAYALPAHTPLVGARVLLVAFFIYFMLGLRAMQALRANAFVGAALVIAGLSGWIAADVVTYLAFAFFCANVIGFAGAYALEHANRTAFLERQLLVEIAALDGLTRLLNRQTFESRVREAWRKAMTERRAVSVIMIDVDHFKLYNDHYGHQAGDDCLRRVSTAVRAAVACGAEDFVARYGGEEIIVVLADRTPAETQAIAQRIVEEVQSLQIAHASAPEMRHVTVSVGATTHHPPFTSSYDSLVKLADGALYEAKRGGRNRSIFVEARAAAAA
jgi:diguanylate cyclase (GGDEF)-like protein